jgi:TolA-binding protein
MKRAITCALILTLFLTSFAFAQESAAKETELLFMAKKAYEDGFYDVALGMLDKFGKDFPDSAKTAEARLLAGQSYFNQGRCLEALTILEALLVDPKNASLSDAIYFWLAELHFKGNNFEKAVIFYQKLINEFPSSSYVPAAYYSLGWSFSRLGKYSQALENFKNLINKFPNEPQSKDAVFKIIECLYNLKEYSELRDKIKSVLKLYANDTLRLPYLYFYLAESEYYLDNFNEAAMSYLKSAQAFKDGLARALARLGLGWSYLKLKKYDEAGEVFADTKKDILDQKSLDILVLGQAVLMSQSNRVYEARKLYQQLISASEDPLIRLQAYIGKADASYNLAEYGQAVKEYEEGLKDIAKTGNQINGAGELIDKLRYNLGVAYIKQGALDSGIAVFEDIAEKSVYPDMKVSLLYQIADAYQNTGDFLKAEEAYAKILKQFPDSSFADYALYQTGLLRLKRLDYLSAIDSFKLLLKDYPRSKFMEEALYSLGTVYFQRKDYALSCEILAKFRDEFKVSRLSGQAVFMLGLSLLNSGKTDEALNIFKSISRQYTKENELMQKAEYEIADCYYRLGREKEALGLFKLLRTKYPDSKITPEIMWWLGQYYYRLNDLNLAARYFSSLAKEYPDNSLSGDALYALGLVFRDENKLDQALDSFKMAVKLSTGESRFESVLAIADIYAQRGKTEEALSQYRQILKTNPDLGSLLFPRIAKCYYKAQDYGQAKLFYQKALELIELKEAGDIQFSLAEVHEAENELEAAIDAYLKVADIYNDNAQLSVRALLRAAKIYEEKGDFKRALGTYEIIARNKTEESGFAQERIEEIEANIK